MRITAAVIMFLLVLAVIGVSSSRQVAADTRIVEFPLVDDVWKLTYFPLWCVVGDNVSGTRKIDITEINKVEIHLKLKENTASDKRPHVFEVSLDGKAVGRFSVGIGMGLDINATLSFEPIETGGSVVIRYKLIAFDSGGIVIIADGSSTLTLSDGFGAQKTKKDFALQALGKLEELRDSVDQSDIDQGLKSSSLSKLDHAIAKVHQALVYIDKDNERQANSKLRIAKNSMVSFVKSVDTFSERIALYSEAWQYDANIIIEVIETAIDTPI